MRGSKRAEGLRAQMPQGFARPYEVERHASSGFDKQAHRRGADSARPSGDESNFAGQ